MDPRISSLSDGSWLYGLPEGSSVGDHDEETHVTTAPMYFKTTNSIVEARSSRIAGRSTRVWKAIQVRSKDDATPVGGAKEIVLKDCWMEGEGRSELEIQRKLFEDIEAFKNRPEGWRQHPFFVPCPDPVEGAQPTKREPAFTQEQLDDVEDLLQDDKYKGLFLRIAFEHKGDNSIPIHACAWQSDEIFPDDKEANEEAEKDNTTSPRKSLASSKKNLTTQPPSRSQDLKASGPSPRAFAQKRRCLTIFREVCTQIDHLPTVGDAIDVLRGAHSGAWLPLIHQ